MDARRQEGFQAGQDVGQGGLQDGQDVASLRPAGASLIISGFSVSAETSRVVRLQS